MVAEGCDTGGDDGAIYENTDFDDLSKESLMRKSSLPAELQQRRNKTAGGGGGRTKSVSSVRHKPARHTPVDYEDPDAVLDDLENDDYIDMGGADMDNMYVDPEDLRRVGSDSSAASSGSFSATNKNKAESSQQGELFFSSKPVM